MPKIAFLLTLLATVLVCLLAYGSFTISQAISIEGQGWSYVAPPANGAAITITAPASDNISIRGVSLNGVGVPNAYGIVFSDGGGLEIVDCTIRNFTGTGVYVGVGSSPPTGTTLLISNTRVLDNPTAGIDLAPQPGAAVRITIDRVTANNNGYGIYMNAALSMTNASQITGTITNSVINSNVNAGIALVGAGSGAGGNAQVFIFVKESNVSSNNLSNNGGAGLSVSGSDSFLVLSHSAVAVNGNGIAVSNNGSIYSAGNNDMTTNLNGPVNAASFGSSPEQ